MENQESVKSLVLKGSFSMGKINWSPQWFGVPVIVENQRKEESNCSEILVVHQLLEIPQLPRLVFSAFPSDVIFIARFSKASPQKTGAMV
jgi:hypothetical protein